MACRAKIQKSMGKDAIVYRLRAGRHCLRLSLYAFFLLKNLEPEKRFLIDNLYR